MKTRTLQVVFGLAVGVGARAALPGHRPAGLVVALLLSLLGAAGGGMLAEAILPADFLPRGGFMLAGMGAIAALLVQAILGV